MSHPGRRSIALVGLVALLGCEAIRRNTARNKENLSTLVITQRPLGAVLYKIDEMPVEREAGTSLTHEIMLRPGTHSLEVTYAFPASGGRTIGGGVFFGGGPAYRDPGVKVQLDAEAGHIYRLEQEYLSGNHYRAWFVDETTGKVVAGPVELPWHG